MADGLSAAIMIALLVAHSVSRNGVQQDGIRFASATSITVDERMEFGGWGWGSCAGRGLTKRALLGSRSVQLMSAHRRSVLGRTATVEHHSPADELANDNQRSLTGQNLPVAPTVELPDAGH